MRYLPHTDEDITSMLQVVGTDTLDDLFSTIPDDCRRAEDLDIPSPLTEWELDDLMDELSGSVAASPEYRMFLGAGRYDHFIPASLTHLISRSEFTTPYTPYQPEMSQGTLQAIYEYQTLAARLLGMEVSNASLYDGASALAEALLMTIRITRRNKVAVSSLIHPYYRRVVRTYLDPAGLKTVELPYLENGRTDLSRVDKLDDLAAVAVQSPNFLGCIEDMTALSKMSREKDFLFVASFTEPIAYGLFKNPGSQGAHIVCGEGQSLGIPKWFGGPGLGMFASKMKYVRSMPGRLVGKSTDKDGKNGFVLTLATREQHIRREKATSNICTNNSLIALAAAIYMASIGGTGIRELAKLNHDKSEYLKQTLEKAGFKISFESPTFNEFVVEFPAGFETTYERLLEKKIVAGIPLAPYYSELTGRYLICVTETKSKEEMDELLEELRN